MRDDFLLQTDMCIDLRNYSRIHHGILLDNCADVRPPPIGSHYRNPVLLLMMVCMQAIQKNMIKLLSY